VFVALRPGAPAPPSGAIAIGGPYSAWSTRAARGVDQRILKGRWSARLFWLHFPAPTSARPLCRPWRTAQQGLGARAKDFQVVFVTVDPAADTPGQLKAYLSSDSFPKGAIGLTGTTEQVAAITRAIMGSIFKSREAALTYSSTTPSGHPIWM